MTVSCLIFVVNIIHAQSIQVLCPFHEPAKSVHIDLALFINLLHLLGYLCRVAICVTIYATSRNILEDNDNN